ncbi:MAG TPA: DUF4230 domain-containing protein [Roseiflexaceae bacterium]|nr:DUF4230 domain-containing protein [Roseiflexaceae bacterium]
MSRYADDEDERPRRRRPDDYADDERPRRRDERPPEPRPRPRRPADERAGWDDYEEEDDPPERPARRSSAPPPERRSRLIEQRLRARSGDFDDEDDGYADEGPPRFTQRPYRSGYSSQGNGCAATTLYAILIFAAIAGVLFLLARQLLNNVPSIVPPQIASVVAQPTPAIIDRGGTILQIRNLNRLETQSFSAERVIEAAVARGNVLDAFLGERLLLIARGDVVAGVDLSKLRDSDVTISADGTRITLRLPPSEIFLARLDNANTRVYDKQTGIGTRLLGSENQDLETQARQSAEGEILKAACESQITQRAADEARQSMEQFLGLLDFESVTVVATAGPCVAPAALNTVPTPSP